MIILNFIYEILKNNAPSVTVILVTIIGAIFARTTYLYQKRIEIKINKTEQMIKDYLTLKKFIINHYDYTIKIQSNNNNRKIEKELHDLNNKFYESIIYDENIEDKLEDFLEYVIYYRQNGMEGQNYTNFYNDYQYLIKLIKEKIKKLQESLEKMLKIKFQN